MKKWLLVVVVTVAVFGVLAARAGPPPRASGTSRVPVATQQAMAARLADRDRIAALLVFGTQPQLSVSSDLEDVTATVGITNTDTVPHTFAPQADFYRVTKDNLGDDPADFLVTAGFTQVTLAAHEQRLVPIHAKNFNHDPVVSVDFRVTGLP